MINVIVIVLATKTSNLRGRFPMAIWNHQNALGKDSTRLMNGTCVYIGRAQDASDHDDIHFQ